MKRRFLSIVVITTTQLVVLTGCATTRARGEVQALIQYARENDEAWRAARFRLHAMCGAGSEPRASCAVRYVKTTNTRRTDDWSWTLMPPYSTIVAVHEEELRARHTLRVYDEYMAAAARHLAAQADHHVITAAQLADGINQGWTWMVEQMRADAVLLMDQVRVATEADARRWETFNTIAAGLAQVLTTAIIAGAVVNANAPPPAAPALSTPTYCQATPGMRNTITGRLMSVNVYCR